ncbi:MAG: succinate dehydrogenase [Burkholderiaceae bacterium]
MQRYSALALVPFVLGHLVTLLLIGSAGLTAQEVLSRTSGSIAWAIFYALFVVLLALHGTIGLWQVGRLLPWLSSAQVSVATGLFAVATLVFGARAALGLYAANGV